MEHRDTRPQPLLAGTAPGHDHLAWESARGAIVRSVDGRELIDFTSGVFVTNTGHCHPRVVEAIQAQAARLLNCYDAPHPLRAQVVERLARLAGPTFDAVSLTTTGAEAIDSSVKAAKAFTGRYETLSFSWAFHGKSLATTVALRPAREPAWGRAGDAGLDRRAVSHLLPLSAEAQVPRVRCGLLRCLREGVRGEHHGESGGCRRRGLPRGGWSLSSRRRSSGRRSASLPMARGQSSSSMRSRRALAGAGTMFAFQQFGIVPDVLVVAKGMASGLPMSAVISRREILEALPAGVLSSTYGGNPFSCAACLATLDVLEDEDLPSRAAALGKRALDRMSHWVGDDRWGRRCPRSRIGVRGRTRSAPMGPRTRSVRSASSTQRSGKES